MYICPNSFFSLNLRRIPCEFPSACFFFTFKIFYFFLPSIAQIVPETTETEMRTRGSNEVFKSIERVFKGLIKVYIKISAYILDYHNCWRFVNKSLLSWFQDANQSFNVQFTVSLTTSTFLLSLQVKDLVARIYTKWQMLLQRTRPLHVQ